jgi:FlaA1/EpsC-like NDP-sugar epimerase
MKEKQKTLNRFQILLDAFTLIAAYCIAYFLRFYSPFVSMRQLAFYSFEEYLQLLLYVVPIYLLLNCLLQVYTPRSEMIKLQELLKLLAANVLGIVCFIFILYIVKDYNISRMFLILFFIINIVLGVSTRLLHSIFTKSLTKAK